MKKMLFIPILALIVTFGALPARADSINFDLNIGNSAINGFPGPYANVSIDANAIDQATVVVNAYSGFLIGDFGLNIGEPVTISDITWIGGNSKTDYTVEGSGNMDGFGVINARIGAFDGYNSAVRQIMFTLNGSLNDWFNSSSILVPNSKGYSSAAHIFVSDETDSSAVATGFAADGPSSSVPEPTTMLLFGAGLMGLAGTKIRSRKLKKK